MDGPLSELSTINFIRPWVTEIIDKEPALGSWN